MARVLVFAGSSRKDSFNRKLAKLAADAVQAAGGQPTLVELKDYPMPIYDGDIEAQGIPPTVQKFKELIKSHDGLLLACPEYNASVTPLMKNTIDWASRPPSEPSVYKGKVALITSASPGALGGLRGQVHVRASLENLGVLVVPQRFAVMKADQAFDDNGKFKDPAMSKNLQQTVELFIQLVNKLKT